MEPRLMDKNCSHKLKATDVNAVLMIPLADIDFSVRTANCMRNNNILNVGDLIQLSEAQLLELPNFGQKSLRELLGFLHNLGLSLGSKVECLESGELHLNQSLQHVLALQEPEKNPFEGLSHDELIEKYASLGLFDKIERLGLSVRARNCLDKINAKYVGDLVLLKKTDLLEMRNFGRKSLTEIEEALKQRELSFDMKLGEWPLENVDQISESIEKESAVNEQEPLISAFNRTIQSISDQRQVLILESRLGINREARTLEDIATELGLTRERVRQIQKKTAQTILRNEFWDDILRIKLQTLMSARSSPLYLDELGIEDKWFQGFSGQLALLKNIISAFSEIDDLRFLVINERTILSRVNNDQWKEAKYDLLNMLEHTIDSHYTIDDIELFVEDKLEKLSAPELSSAMFESLSKDLNFSYIDGQMTLLSVGNSLASHLKVVLEEQPQPLHYEEVVSLYEQKYGVPISERYVHSCLGYSNFILFDRGTYGIEKHLDISDYDQKEIIEKVEELISSGPQGRQWHSRNIAKIFKDSGFYSKLNKYTITAILKKSTRLTYLGKFLWKLHSEQDDLSERLHIKKVAYDALKRAGAPLRTEALIVEISKTRGVGEHLQLHPNELFSRVDPSTWGLLERDFIIPLEQQSAFRDMMYIIFKSKGFALHKSELANQEFSTSPPEGLLGGHMMGLLIIDPRFKSWHGGLVGLSEWESSGRKTFNQVMLEVAQEVISTISTDAIVESAREKLGYDFNMNRISVYLNKYGLFYDRDGGLWKKL